MFFQQSDQQFKGPETLHKPLCMHTYHCHVTISHRYSAITAVYELSDKESCTLCCVYPRPRKHEEYKTLVLVLHIFSVSSDNLVVTKLITVS